MVICINIYKFELNPTSSGDIEPEFKLLSSEFAEESKDLKPEDMATTNDLFSILFHHSTGMSFGKRDDSKNFFVGRLKEKPFKVISYFRQEIDESQYLTIAFFKLDEEVELFERNIHNLATELNKSYLKLAQGNLKDVNFILEMKKEMRSKISFTNFQIERLSNLDKVQKVALIYSSPERVRTLQVLRNGPVSRRALRYELEKIKENPNLDLTLAPFLELNLVRRDWAKGVRDTKAGIVRGEGEFLFLVKDIALLRKPPEKILDQMKKNSNIGPAFNEAINKYYQSYDPFGDLEAEAQKLARLLLNPDIYDFLALIKERVFPEEKIPKMTSDFSSSQEILTRLLEAEVIVKIKAKDNMDWILPLCEITPMVVFPEYLITRIKDRVEFKGSMAEDTAVDAPLTSEVARKALDLLETTYNEVIEF